MEKQSITELDLINLFSTIPSRNEIESYLDNWGFGKTDENIRLNDYFYELEKLNEYLLVNKKKYGTNFNEQAKLYFEYLYFLNFHGSVPIKDYDKFNRIRSTKYLKIIDLISRIFERNDFQTKLGWEKDQYEKVLEGIRYLKTFKTYFFSYTNNNSLHINSIFSKIVGDKKVQNLNLIVKNIVLTLNNQIGNFQDSVDYFYDRDDNLCQEANVVARCLSECEKSITLLQLIQKEIFNRDPENNIPYKEFEAFFKNNKTITFIIFETFFLENNKYHSDFGKWIQTVLDNRSDKNCWDKFNFNNIQILEEKLKPISETILFHKRNFFKNFANSI